MRGRSQPAGDSKVQVKNPLNYILQARKLQFSRHCLFDKKRGTSHEKHCTLRDIVFIFIVNPLKFLYYLKGDFGRIRNDQ